MKLVFFQLSGLAKLCLDSFPTMLNVDNVSEILEISYDLDLEDIKVSGFKFVWDNLDEVCKTAEFKNLLKIEPGLMIDIVRMTKELTTKALAKGNFYGSIKELSIL